MNYSLISKYACVQLALNCTKFLPYFRRRVIFYTKKPFVDIKVIMVCVNISMRCSIRRGGCSVPTPVGLVITIISVINANTFIKQDRAGGLRPDVMRRHNVMRLHVLRARHPARLVQIPRQSPAMVRVAPRILRQL